MAQVEKLLLPPEGLVVALSGDRNRFLVLSEETGGSYAQWEAIVPPGGGPILHVHSREDETFFILEGELHIHAGDRDFIARPGTFVNLPRGVPHGFRNESSTTARVLITVIPGGLEGMFLEAGTHLEPGSQIAPESSPEERERLRAAAPRYGIRFVSGGH